MKYIPAPRPKLFGPPSSASNKAIFTAIKARCIQCPYCMENWHADIERKGEAAIQVKLAGKTIAARRAMYLAAFPDNPIQEGYRVTSRCKNPNCVNPRLLMQAKPGYILAAQYKLGQRDKKAATRHLVMHKLSRSTLSDAAVTRIRDDKRKGKEAAHEYGISPEYYNAIQRRDARAKVYA